MNEELAAGTKNAIESAFSSLLSNEEDGLEKFRQALQGCVLKLLLRFNECCCPKRLFPDAVSASAAYASNIVWWGRSQSV